MSDGGGGAALAGGRSTPQSWQNVATGRGGPAEPQLAHWRPSPGLAAGWPKRSAAISAVTIPVGTARIPQPSSIMKLATARPRSVFGVMSPKPTVVIVVMAQ